MGLPTEILQFFAVDANDNSVTRYKTIKEFLLEPQYASSNALEILQIVQKLKLEGYLVSAGFTHSSNKITTFEEEMLVCYNFDKAYAEYGEYDFIVEGFSAVARHFQNSVKPISFRNEQGDLDIGTGFLLFDTKYMLTAKHVINHPYLIEITNGAGEIAEVQDVLISSNDSIDLAIIRFSNSVFEGLPCFQLRIGKLLEDVMTIGYPPIPGFDAIQIYEKSSINNSYKFSKGQIVGGDTSYLDGVNYLIINAKVKGGNSGSPVINNAGTVVGAVVQVCHDSQDMSKLDSLGYGVVTPASEIDKLFGEDLVPLKSLKVINHENGFQLVPDNSKGG
jgi:serine protease Do